MKGTEKFKQIIQSYLESRASTDKLFANKYASPEKNIDDCCTYIINQVHKSGICGFEDEAIYSMAVHYYDEENIEVGTSIQCQVVVNSHIELTEEEKEEQRQLAKEEYRKAELRKIQEKNTPKPKAKSASKDTNVQPLLFDF